MLSSQPTICLCLLISSTLTFSLFNKISLSNKTGAVCLDGSQPAFYLWQPDSLDTNKTLIYF
jgi:hypothetical protein